ncbi:MAG: hypothetical protein CMB80_00890 [Flammeovirgaceae bacterium]|nr:hypothetical protein [Flammeovirgaceae bacterium]
MKCDDRFPVKKNIDGKERNLQNRKFCLQCSPFGQHNTRDLTKPVKKRGARYLIKCVLCHEEKQTTSRNRVCPRCRFVKKRHAQRKKALDLTGAKCCICGYNTSIKALAFHHVDRAKKVFNLSANWHRPWEQIEAELKKCILVCCNCHAETHDNLHDTYYFLTIQWS